MMEKKDAYGILLGFALIFLIISFIMILTNNEAKAGLLLILFFISLSFGVKRFQAVKGLSFTIWIFTAVTASMFYPQYFVSIGDFKLKALIVPLLQIIMFGMGSQMSLNDFTGVIKMPKGVIIGVGSHYLFMPLMAFIITRFFNFPPQIAAGIILVGCVPSGLASNVMSFIARANLALAVTIGATSTIISPFVTPLLMRWFGGQYVKVNAWSMMLDILNMMILPIIAGFIFNLFNEGKERLKPKAIQLIAFLSIILITALVYMEVKKTGVVGFLKYLAKSVFWFYFLPIIVAVLFRHFLKGEKQQLSKILSLISMVGIAIIVTLITAAGRDSLLKVGVLLLLISIFHNIAGYILGYGVAWLFRMPEQDRRTIAFEVGMPNAGLASGLALQMGEAAIATVGLAPAIYGPLMNVTGSTVASLWRNKHFKRENENPEIASEIKVE